MNPNQHLTEDVRNKVTNIEQEKCESWGGQWVDGEAAVTTLPIDTDHTERTLVRSNEDAVEAFEKYTEYFEFVLENYTPSTDEVVLVPCGASKPIGSSSSHQKKLNALDAAEYTEYDLNIMSEPCTIAPHEHRLALPPVNYDFPPEYTEKGDHENVFDIFADRLAQWIDEMGYDVIFAYLVKRHQNKLDAAIERSESDPELVEISGASYNPETDSYSGDQFKSTEHIKDKLVAARELCYSNGDGDLSSLPDSSAEFYRDRFGE